MNNAKLFLSAMLLSLVGFTAVEVQASSRQAAKGAELEQSQAADCWGCRNGACVSCRVVGGSAAGSTACLPAGTGLPFCNFIGTECTLPPC